jgi:hypothetical protein
VQLECLRIRGRAMSSKNLAALAIDRHLIQEGESWFIIIPPVETKTSTAIEFAVPEILTPYLSTYLYRHRFVRRRRWGGASFSSTTIVPFGRTSTDSAPALLRRANCAGYVGLREGGGAAGHRRRI